MKGTRVALAGLWRAVRPLQWRLVWLSNAKFVCGVTGVVRAEDGQILLLRHRVWPPDRQWGFPSGYALSGETHEDTVAREVFEETGLTVVVGRLLRVRTGFRYRVEFYYEATLTAGLEGLTLEADEILEARLCTLDELPAEMPQVHRELALAASGVGSLPVVARELVGVGPAEGITVRGDPLGERGLPCRRGG
jgi:ADP-ribose pyrophosphatase YjhB (NUDIX family)